MILGAHDAITSCEAKQFFLRPFEWLARCQHKDIDGLLNSKVKCFDFRIRFRNDKPYLCHGLMEYDENINYILDYLEAHKVTMYIRLGYENIFNSNDYEKFLDFSHQCIEKYPHLKFMICKKKPQWTVIENYFEYPLVEVETYIDWKKFIFGPEHYKGQQDDTEYRDKDIIVLEDFI